MIALLPPGRSMRVADSIGGEAPPARDFLSRPGMGASANVGARTVHVGNEGWLREALGLPADQAL